MAIKTERERQAEQEGACGWVVFPGKDFASQEPIEVRSATENGAFRVAQAEYPGVPWISATPGYLVRERFRSARS